MNRNRVALMIVTGLCLALFAGCGLKLGDVFTEEVNTLEGVEIVIEKVTPTGLVYAISNQSDRDVSYGRDFGIQMEKDGAWYQVEPDNPAAVTLELLTVPAGGRDEMEISWEDSYGKLPEGKFRIVKTISDTEQGYYLSGEFCID